MAVEILISYTDPTSSGATIRYDCGVKYSAFQTFILNNDSVITKVDAWMGVQVAFPRSHPIVCQIFAADANHKKTGSSLGSATTTVSQLPYDEYTFTFSSPVSLSGNTRYGLYFSPTISNGVGYTVGLYAGGEAGGYADGQWTAYKNDSYYYSGSLDEDIWFKLWGELSNSQGGNGGNGSTSSTSSTTSTTTSTTTSSSTSSTMSTSSTTSSTSSSTSSTTSTYPGYTEGVAKSVAVIPSSTEDEVWMVVTRMIKGVEVTYLEQMQPRDYGDLEDAFFVDSGLKYDGDPLTTFDGLDHLEGERVAILGDGVVQTSKIVNSSGEVTVASAVSVAVIGLPYRFTLQPMRFDMIGPGGTTKGTLKRFAELVISFFESGGNIQYGVDVDNLFDIADLPSTGLFTGDVVVVADGGFSVEDSVIITGVEPLPCCIRCLVPRIKVTGR